MRGYYHTMYFVTLQYRHILNVLKYDKDNMALGTSVFFSTATVAFRWQVLNRIFLVSGGLGQHLSYPRTELAFQVKESDPQAFSHQLKPKQSVR